MRQRCTAVTAAVWEYTVEQRGALHLLYRAMEHLRWRDSLGDMHAKAILNERTVAIEKEARAECLAQEGKW